jgi:hypothetical protein
MRFKEERLTGALFLKKQLIMVLRISLALSALCLVFVTGLSTVRAHKIFVCAAQETFPSPPSDQTLVYLAEEKGALTPLPFEAGVTPLRVEMAATSDKRSYVEIKGERAPTVITNDLPRFYLFLPDKPDAKPPFVVRLTEKGRARRVTAMAQKGYKGYAIAAEDIIKPHYRILSREGGMQFMEIRMREPLLEGEYAIIGTDLQHIATFRVAAALNR